MINSLTDYDNSLLMNDLSIHSILVSIIIILLSVQFIQSDKTILLSTILWSWMMFGSAVEDPPEGLERPLSSKTRLTSIQSKAKLFDPHRSPISSIECQFVQFIQSTKTILLPIRFSILIVLLSWMIFQFILFSHRSSVYSLLSSIYSTHWIHVIR